jgi:hypothetical protein
MVPRLLSGHGGGVLLLLLLVVVAEAVDAAV